MAAAAAFAADCGVGRSAELVGDTFRSISCLLSGLGSITGGLTARSLLVRATVGMGLEQGLIVSDSLRFFS